MKCKINFFVAILENGRHLEISIGQCYRMDLTGIEMPHAKCGDCITICTIHPKNAYYMLHCNSVTTCPNVVSLTKCVIAGKYYVPYI